MPVLCYHNIVEDQYADQGGVSASDFREEMQTLRELGYSFITPADLLAALNGTTTLPERSVMVTFDDSLKSTYDLAYPVLKEMEIPAVVNIIGYQVEYDYNYNTSLLNWEEAEEMAKSGLITLGSQTWNCAEPLFSISGNRIYPLVDHKDNESQESYVARINADFQKNNDKIQEHTGQTPVSLAWPYGYASPEAETAMAAHGLMLGFDTSGSRANDLSLGVDPHHIQRYVIDQNYAIKDFIILINSDN